MRADWVAGWRGIRNQVTKQTLTLEQPYEKSIDGWPAITTTLIAHTTSDRGPIEQQPSRHEM